MVSQDVAQAAVETARAAAAERGVVVTFERHDLTQTFPDGSYDLVTAQFLQAPVGWPRAQVLRRALAAVAPGGRLLVVDHADPPPWSQLDKDTVGFPTPEQVLTDLAAAKTHETNFGEVAALGAGWQVERAEVSARDATGPAREHGHLNDSVVLVHRIA